MPNNHLWIVTYIGGEVVKYSNVKNFKQLIDRLVAVDKLNNSNDLSLIARVERI